MDRQIKTKFGMVTSLGFPDPLSKQNLTWWPIAIWKIENNHDISQKICANFSKILLC